MFCKWPSVYRVSYYSRVLKTFSRGPSQDPSAPTLSLSRECLALVSCDHISKPCPVRGCSCSIHPSSWPVCEGIPGEACHGREGGPVLESSRGSSWEDQPGGGSTPRHSSSTLRGCWPCDAARNKFSWPHFLDASFCHSCERRGQSAVTSDKPDTTSFAGVGDWGHNDRPVALSRESSERRAGQKGLLGSCLMGSEACHYPESSVPSAGR